MMRMWCGIADCVTKTILSSTHVFAAYRKRSCAPDTKCFHILGFDIMLDSDLQPHLLEVNTSPSFNGDAGVDTRVKTAVLMQALKLAKVVPLARRHCKMHHEEVEEEVAICEEAEMKQSIAHLSTAGKLLARLRGVRRRRDSRAALDTEQVTESKEVAVAKSSAKVSPPRKSNSRRGSEASAAIPTNKVHSKVSKESPKTPKRRIPLSKISPAPTPPGSPSSGLYVSVVIGSPTSRRLSRTAPSPNSPKNESKNTPRTKSERINVSVTPRRTPRVRKSPRVTRHGISAPIEHRHNKVDPKLVFDWDRMNATGSQDYWRLYPAQIPETQKVFDYIERLASENIKLPYDA